MAKKKQKSPARKASTPKKKKAVKPVAMLKEIVRTAAKPIEKRQRFTPAAPLAADQVQKFRDVLTQKRDDLLAIVQRKKEEEIEDVGVGDEADIAMHSVE